MPVRLQLSFIVVTALLAVTAEAVTPNAPGGVSAAGDSTSSVRVSWSTTANATRYKVRNKTTGGESGDVTSTSYTWPGLASGTNYCFTVIACNVPGVCSSDSLQSCASPAVIPNPPSNVSASVPSATSVAITWSASAGATRYHVRNKTTGGETGDLTSTSYTWPGLTSGTNYCFTVIACNVPGVCSADSQQSCATPAAIPAPPANVATSAPSSTSVAVTWSASTGATRYHVRNKTTGGETGDLTSTSYTWPGLTSGTNYCFTVIACNVPGVCSSDSQQSCATPAATPAPPTNVATSAPSSTSVAITWTASAGATRYHVRNNTTGGETGDITSTSYTWPGLTAGTNYCFTVIACNVPGVCSADSLQSCATPAATPAPPANVATSAASGTSVAITWSASAGATRYHVRNNTTGGETGDVTSTSYTWPGLTAGTNYCFTVIACNVPGVCSSDSQQSCATPAATPAPPANVAASAASGTSVAITWSASAGATRYHVRNKTTGGETGDLTSTSYTWPGLTSGTNYCFTVIACNVPGVCSSDNLQSCATPAATPAPPTNVATSAPSSTAVAVTWTASAGATRYHVRNNTTGGETGDITSTSYTWPNLASGTNYCFTVIACNVPGVCSSDSQQSCATPAVIPAPPTNVATSAPSSTSVTITWSASAGATRYHVRNKTTGGETGDLTSTSYTWPGLTSGTNYCFTVIACNVPGVCSSDSLQSCATPAAIPAPPANVATSAASSTSVAVTWSASAGATRYHVRNKTTGGESGDITSTPYTWPNLTSGTNYCFTVIACNVPGVCSSDSQQSCATPASTPAPPANVATSAASPTSVAISWTASAGATRYHVRNKTTGAESIDITSTPYTWPNLTSGTNYCFTVIACNLPGVCSSDSLQSCATPASTPAPPANVATSAASPTSVAISWSASAGATRYHVRNKTTAGESGDTTSTSYTWPNLTSGTNYCFTVIACNVPGVCSSDSQQSCATPASTPAPPANVAASAASGTSVAITWSASAGATRYHVRNKTTVGESGDITSTSYTWPNLTSGTNYCFTVIACNLPGICGAESASSCATPAAGHLQLFPAAVPLNRPAGAAGQTTFVWSVTADNARTVWVDIHNPLRGTTTPFPMLPEGAAVAGRQLYRYEQPLNSVALYSYRFRADGYGSDTASLPADGSFFGGPDVGCPAGCAQPGAFTLVAPAAGATVSTLPTLTWTAAGEIAAYDVYLWKSGEAPLRAGAVSTTSFAPPKLAASTSYSWKVVARATCECVTESSSGTRTFTTAAAAPASEDAPLFIGEPVVSPSSGVKNLQDFRWTALLKNATSATVVIIDPVNHADNRFAMVKTSSSDGVDTWQFSKKLISDGAYRFRIDATSADGIGTGAPAPPSSSNGPAVFPEGGTPITVDFALNPERPLAGELIHFSSQTPVQNLSYAWDFGDGSSSIEANPEHAYESPATYNVTLTVSQNGGASMRSAMSTASDAGAATVSKSVDVARNANSADVLLKGRVTFDGGSAIANAVVETRLVSYAQQTTPIYRTTDPSGYFTVSVPRTAGARWRISARAKKELGDPYLFESYNEVVFAIDERESATLPDIKVHNPVILIHGWQPTIFGDATARWENWRQHLRAMKFPAVAVNYHFLDPRTQVLISRYWYAQDIAYKVVIPQITDFLSKVATGQRVSVLTMPGSSVDYVKLGLPVFFMIGHSKGGLVARAISSQSPLSPLVRRIVTLATPNNGAYLSPDDNLSPQYVQKTFNATYQTYGLPRSTDVLTIVGCDDWVVRYEIDLPFVIHEGAVPSASDALTKGCEGTCRYLPSVARNTDHTSIGTDELYSEVSEILLRNRNHGGIFNAVPPRCDASSGGGGGSWKGAPVSTEGVGGETTVVRESGFRTDAGETHIRYRADGLTTTISISLAGGQERVRVLRPDGTDVAAQLANRDGMLGGVVALAAGVWDIVLPPRDGDDGAYLVNVIADDGLSLAMSGVDGARIAGDPVRIALTAPAGVTLDRVTIHLQRGLERLSSVEATSGAGAFSATFPAPSEPNAYAVRAVVEGREGSTPFQRTLEQLLIVATSRIRLTGAIDDSVIDTDGDGRRDTVAADVEVEAREAGDYYVSGDLIANGARVAHGGQLARIETAGIQKVRLLLPFRAMPCVADPKLSIRNLTIVDSEHALVPALGPAIVHDVRALVAAGEAECGSASIAADFAVSRMVVRPGDVVQFENRSTGSLTALKWDFGDGTRSTAPAPSHAFATEGTYFVRLQIEGAGETDDAVQEIRVTTVNQRQRVAGH
ncbi:MAG: hypothetical protein QOI24_3651 [Acidobacteriota bacterium]|nr:hypothetical protein [Acidobacteriota bacterium]